MSFIEDFPHTSIYDKDLGWLIRQYKELNDNYEVLKDIYNIVKEQIYDVTLEQLKEWLNDGTLTNILNKLKVYDTVTDMLNSLEINEGDYVLTCGYYSINDGGGTLYKIEITNDIFNLRNINNLYCNVIINDNVSSIQLGVPTDGSIDCTDLLQKTIDFVKQKGFSSLTIPKGTYLINPIDKEGTPETGTYLRDKGGIKIPSNFTLNHSSDTIIKAITNNHQAYNIYRIYNVENVVINNGVFIGDRETHQENVGEWGYCIAISGSKNIKINNVECYNAHGDCINIQYLYDETSLPQNDRISTNIEINNSKLSNSYRNCLSIENGYNIRIVNCLIEKANGTKPQSGVDIEPASSKAYIDSVTFINCYFKENQSRNVSGTGDFVDSPIKNIHFYDCEFGESYSPDLYNIAFTNNFERIIFNNCRFLAKTNKIIVNNSNGSMILTRCLLEDFKIVNFAKLIVENCNVNYVTMNRFLENRGINNTVTALLYNNLITVHKDTLLYQDNIKPTTNFFNNYVYKVGDSPRYLMDIVGNMIVNASNNYFDSNKITFTNSALPSTAKISQGGMAGYVCGGARPYYANKGDVVFTPNQNKLIVYNGEKWYNTDGTEFTP